MKRKVSAYFRCLNSVEELLFGIIISKTGKNARQLFRDEKANLRPFPKTFWVFNRGFDSPFWLKEYRLPLWDHSFWEHFSFYQEGCWGSSLCNMNQYDCFWGVKNTLNAVYVGLCGVLLVVNMLV